MRLAMLKFLVRLVLARVVAGQEVCSAGTVANSNRGTSNLCQGSIGEVCEYHCDAGFYPIGQHVCQTYMVDGTPWINRTFFGGRCARICDGQPTCEAAEQVVRVNATDQHGQCFRVVCFRSGDEALRWLARSNYEMWAKARDSKTGLYNSVIDLLSDPISETTVDRGSPTGTGPGLIIECVADAMKWVDSTAIQSRILLTLQTLNGLTELPKSTKIERSPEGFFHDPFSTPTPNFAMMGNGLLMTGVLFAKRYYSLTDPEGKLPHTTDIVRLADALWNSTRFDTLPCNRDMRMDPEGDGIPMLHSATEPGKCSAVGFPQDDGWYVWDEEHYTVDFAFEQACGGQAPGQCNNTAMETLWTKWQGRRMYPTGNNRYKEHDLLSRWPGYIVQLPYYTVHSFNSDPTYMRLFRSHWLADWDYFRDNATTQNYYAGDRGRYGLGAGPTPPECTQGSTYFADRIAPNDPHSKGRCRMYSPYTIAGYLPIPDARETIQAQLLELLEDGEAVLPFAIDAMSARPRFILWRKSMLEVEWVQGYAVTLVDVAAEVLGLATIWLGMDFYEKNTDHFQRGSSAEFSEKEPALVV